MGTGAVSQRPTCWMYNEARIGFIPIAQSCAFCVMLARHSSEASCMTRIVLRISGWH